MICSHCYKSFSVNAIHAQRGKGLSAQIQCPHCHAWLGRSPRLARLKLLAFYLGLVAASLAWLWLPWRTAAILLTLFCIVLLMVVHLMDHLQVVEAPEVQDTSHERQKYR